MLRVRTQHYSPLDKLLKEKKTRKNINITYTMTRIKEVDGYVKMIFLYFNFGRTISIAVSRVSAE